MVRLSLLISILILPLAACGGSDDIDESGSVGTTSSAPDAPTTDAGDEGAGELSTLFVDSQRVDCVGVGPQQCLRVRSTPEADWTLFYDSIVGFDFEPGYQYELRVEITDVENPPADASSLRYTLVEVVSKTTDEATTDEATTDEATTDEATDDEMSDAMPLSGTTWTVIEIEGEPTLESARPSMVFGEDGTLSGDTSCNSFSGAYDAIDDGLTIPRPLAVTRKACPPPIASQEAAFLSVLEALQRYEIDEDGRLLLKIEDRVAAIATAGD